jgi:hypothetical protein
MALKEAAPSLSGYSSMVSTELQSALQKEPGLVIKVARQPALEFLTPKRRQSAKLLEVEAYPGEDREPMSLVIVLN